MFIQFKYHRQQQVILIIMPVLFSILSSCIKEETTTQTEPDFVLSSPAIGADSLLPIEYTCDGQSFTLPLKWTGEPENTVCFAVIMHHVASPTDIHWYWILYNIPADVHYLPENVTGIGTLGTNSVNNNVGYSPPCSKGPGIKTYTYTIYSLSEYPDITFDESQVNREVLLNAMDGITLSTACMNVYYSRNVN